VIEAGMKRLGKNRVGIPRRFYKVLCMNINGKVEGVGFIFENRDYGKTSLKSMMLPIDEVEREVGIDFFHSMPEEVQAVMESRVDPSCWSF
ncbi:DNA/RNA non-specific endonuclease, partial [gut metagenome]